MVRYIEPFSLVKFATLNIHACCIATKKHTITAKDSVLVKTIFLKLFATRETAPGR